MYVRHDDDGNVSFVPEDGSPHRDFVPTCNVRAVDPPVRRHFINSKPAYKRATALIQGYVESRVGCKDPEESKACRAFLKTWHSISADGNEMGVDLAAIRASANAVQFFFHIHGVGPVTWLPVLVTASNDRTSHIMRETGACRSAFVEPEGRNSDQVLEPPQRRIPPKVPTVLIRPNHS